MLQKGIVSQASFSEDHKEAGNTWGYLDIQESIVVSRTMNVLPT